MSNEITPEELARIQARCDQASPGPWKAMIEGRDHTSGSSFIMVGASLHGLKTLRCRARPQRISISSRVLREDLPRLIEEIRRLRTLLDQCQFVRQDNRQDQHQIFRDSCVTHVLWSVNVAT